MKPAWTTLSTCMSKLEAVRGVKPMKAAWTTRSMSKVEAVRGVKPMKRSSERDEAYEFSCWNTLFMSKVEAVRGE